MRMKLLYLLPLLLLCLPAHAETDGMRDFLSVRHCVMENDATYCRSILTPDSYNYFDRFSSYKLMPCLPTDFTYESEATSQGQTTVKATMPAGGGKLYVIRLVFSDTPAGHKLDLPASFKRGFGEKWESEVQLAEQVYLLMRQNMGDKLTCDKLNGLITPK